MTARASTRGRPPRRRARADPGWRRVRSPVEQRGDGPDAPGSGSTACALYFSGWYAATLDSRVLHELLHLALHTLEEAVDQQELGGALLWAFGDIIGLLFLAVLLTQWMRAREREAQREDRRLDRLDAAAGG